MFAATVPTFLFAAIALLPPPAAAVHRQLLPSGIHLLVSPRPEARLVAIEIRVRGAGSARERQEENGLAHAVEHMVFKGSAARAPGAVDAEFERMGGEAIAQTLRDGTAYRVSIFRDQWKAALGMWGEVLQKPAFRETDWAAEHLVILREMDVAQSETSKLGLQTVASIAYPAGDSYRQPLMGNRANVEKFSTDDLRRYHAERYRAQNLTVAVSGPVTLEEVAAAVNELWPAAAPSDTETAKTPPSVPPAEPASVPTPAVPSSPVRAPLFTDGEQTARTLATVFLGFPAPRLQSDPDRAAACDVLAAMLAHGTGGVLGERLRSDRKFEAISVSAEYLPQADRALFVLQATGAKRHIGQIEDAIVEEMSALKARCAGNDETMDTQLAGAKAAAIQAAHYPRETVEGDAKYLAYLDMLDAPADYAGKYKERVEAVTAADLLRLLSQHITPEKRRVVVIGLPAIGGAESIPARPEGAEAVP